MRSKLERRGSRRERGRRSGRGGGRDGRGVDVGIGVDVAIVGQVQFRRRHRRAALLSVPESVRSRLPQPRVRAELASLVEGVARHTRGAQQLHGARRAVTLSSQTDTDGDNGQRAEADMRKRTITGQQELQAPLLSAKAKLTARPMADGWRSGGAEGRGSNGASCTATRQADGPAARACCRSDPTPVAAPHSQPLPFCSFSPSPPACPASARSRRTAAAGSAAAGERAP